MSLIEDALDRAEKEKADDFPQEVLPAGTPQAPENFHVGSSSRSKNLLLIISILCIAGSATWLYFWWNQHNAQLTGTIQLSANRHTASGKPPEAVGLPPDSGQPLSTVKSAPTPSKPAIAAVQGKMPAAAPASSASEKKRKGTPVKTSPVVSTPTKAPVKNRRSASSSKHTTSPRHSASHRHTVRMARHKKRHKHHVHAVRTAGVKRHSPAKTRPHKAVKEPLSRSLARKAINEATRAYQRGNYQKAAEALEKSVTYAEPTAEILGFLGNVYFKAGEYNKAYRALSKALHKAPGNSKYLEALGMATMAKGAPARAIPLFLKSLRAAPFKYTARVNLGIAYWKTGNLPAAEKQLKNAITLEKSRPEAYFNLSGVYEASGKLQEAARALRTFLANAKTANMTKEIAVARKHLGFLEGYIQGKGKK